jgi:hypothetical protein
VISFSFQFPSVFFRIRFHPCLIWFRFCYTDLFWKEKYAFFFSFLSNVFAWIGKRRYLAMPAFLRLGFGDWNDCLFISVCMRIWISVSFYLCLFSSSVPDGDMKH